MTTYPETRKDGWPLCPVCGEDELWSALPWNGDGERPPMQAWIDHGLRCYKCGWDSRPAASLESVASDFAAAVLRRQHDAGRDIEIPSLGIVIPGKKASD